MSSSLSIMSRAEVHQALRIASHNFYPASERILKVNQFILKGGRFPCLSELEPPVSSIGSMIRFNRLKNWDNITSLINPITEQAISQAKGNIAVELGGGCSLTTWKLLRSGWKVHNVDVNEESLEKLYKKVHSLAPSLLSSLSLHATKMEHFSWPKEISLVVAQDSLPFCHPDNIQSIFQNAYQALKPEGIFTGSLYQVSEEPIDEIQEVILINEKAIACGAYLTKEKVSPLSTYTHTFYTLQYGGWFCPDRRLAQSLLQHHNFKITSVDHNVVGGIDSCRFIGKKT